jgi:hypothetical protein
VSIEECTKKKVGRWGSRLLSPVLGAQTIYTDYMHLVMMVFLAQLAEGGVLAHPPFYNIHSSYVAPSSLAIKTRKI